MRAVDGHVLIYIHKELELDDVESRYPAEHYVFIDDKVRMLTAIKDVWKDRVTTIFPRQGHYALDPGVAAYPQARCHHRAHRRSAQLEIRPLNAEATLQHSAVIEDFSFSLHSAFIQHSAFDIQHC